MRLNWRHLPSLRVAELEPATDYDVLLVNPPYRHRHGGGIVPPIGLCYLAGKLKSVGAKPNVVDLAGLYPSLGSEVPSPAIQYLATELEFCRKRRPVLIGIGPLVTATLRSVREIASLCHEMLGVPVVVVDRCVQCRGSQRLQKNSLA